MAGIYKSVEELIGNTPLMELTNIEKKYEVKAKILAKLECQNPAGSIKDRVGKAMIDAAEESGELKKGGIIIEPTSGNTGIGIASIAAVRGYKAIIVMPDSMSIERINTMKAYGAQVVLTKGSEGMKGAIAKAEELHEENPGSIIAGQFVNPANPKAHEMTTGPEIWSDTDGKVDYLVAGIGTGGTITGTGRYLKSKNSSVKVVGIEPASSPVLTKGYNGAHKIQGIGAGFVPEIFDNNICDDIILIEDEAALSMGREIAKEEGIMVGISSGAALAAAIDIAKKDENKGKLIVVIMPDSGDRYLSTELFSF